MNSIENKGNPTENDRNLIEYKLISDYKHNNHLRAAYNQLAREVFAIDFEIWYQLGFWDDGYVSYSYVGNDGRLISNVSASQMNVIIDGIPRQAMQIGAVMTHPNYRGQGLSSQLMKQVISIYEPQCDLIFLFANPQAVSFYPQFGFLPYPESQFKIDWAGFVASAPSPLHKLDVLDAKDREWVKQKIASSQPVSQTFGAVNNLRGFMFYALYVFRDSLYYWPEDDTIVVFEQEGSVLHLYDVLSPRVYSGEELHELLRRIAGEQTETIQFHFTPDKRLEGLQIEPAAADADQLFIKANFSLDSLSPFCVPLIVHT